MNFAGSSCMCGLSAWHVGHQHDATVVCRTVLMAAFTFQAVLEVMCYARDGWQKA